MNTKTTKVQPSSEKNRYSDSELEEFKMLILNKLNTAKEELNSLSGSLRNEDYDKRGTIEDGAATLQKETSHQIAGRQKKFIQDLENALIRIANKTYGVCRQTGKLIPKERLRAVPHTTLSMEAKLNAA